MNTPPKKKSRIWKPLLIGTVISILSTTPFTYADENAGVTRPKVGDHVSFAVGNTDYVNAKIITIGPDYVIVLNRGSIATIKAISLPEEIQEQFGFDLNAAKKDRAERARANRERQRLAKEQRESEARTKHLQQTVIESRIEILQVVEDGIMAKPILSYRGVTNLATVPKVTYHTRTRGLYPGETISRTSYVKEDQRKSIQLRDRIFIRCDTTGLVDGQYRTAMMWEFGTYAYTNTMGARQTVPLYTTDPAEYLLSLLE